MLKLTLDSVTGVSAAPLRLATLFGMLGFVVAFVVGIFALWSKFTGASVAGWASTVVVISGFGAVQLLCLGLLGEYVGRMYASMQARPTHYVAYDSLDTTAATPAQATAHNLDPVGQPAPGYERAASAA